MILVNAPDPMARARSDGLGWPRSRGARRVASVRIRRVQAVEARDRCVRVVARPS